MQTLEEFLEDRPVAIRCREVRLGGKHNYTITEPWAAHQYVCELHGSNGDPPVRTLMGSDNGPPEATEVLDAIAAEAAVVEEARRYEEWALHMGFDPDSRHGERVYRASRRQAKLLRQLLGDDGYEQLLWETERL
jgi:hypothetical protein